MQGRLTAPHLALILAVVAFWGYSFVLIKLALGEVPPFALAALRFLFAAVPICLFVPRPRMSATAVVGYGLAIGVWQFGLLFLGMKLGMPAGLSSLAIQIQVFFTMLLAVAVMHERLHLHNLVAAFIAAAGMVVLASYKLATGATATFTGFVLVIAAALGWAVGNILAKRTAGEHGDMFSLVVWSSLVPPLPLALMSYVFEGGGAAWSAVTHMSLTAWVCVLGLSYGATLFGYGSWNRLLHRYPAATVSPFALLIPATGLASGALFLGERISAMQAVGVALVLLGLVVNVLPRPLRGASARDA
ncbi:MAG: EamA family transporter [Pseudomonadota bacterium]|nr:EamA family transporter [Pseudomonadota bacterium]